MALMQHAISKDTEKMEWGKKFQYTFNMCLVFVTTLVMCFIIIASVGYDELNMV